MTNYILPVIALWLAFNVWFVWMRLRAAELKSEFGAHNRSNYGLRF